ncbi:MAG TPA: response regulator [Ktedonobacteraceae bacterium]
MKQQQREPGIQESQPEKFILVVEDDAANGEVIELVITAETPYRVRCASTAEAALQLISERKPDLLLLDDLLPGMHGLELYDYLHTIPALSTIPALLISANNHRSEEVERHHLTFLPKPYEIATLLETIHALLERE